MISTMENDYHYTRYNLVAYAGNFRLLGLGVGENANL